MSDAYSIDNPNDVTVVIEDEAPAGGPRRSGGGDELARARAEAAQWRQQAQQNANAAISNAIESEKAKAEAAVADFANAAETGDWQKQGEAQRQIARSEARLANLEARATGPAPRPSSGDPVEDFCAQLSPASADFVRRHPECATDPKMHNRMLGGHYDAIASGIEVDSSQYFAHVQSKLGGSANSSGFAKVGRTVTLTASQKKMATDGTLVHNFNDPNGKFKKGDPIGVTEYARRLLAMKDAGYDDRLG
jgi:hypothetical protein